MRMRWLRRRRRTYCEPVSSAQLVAVVVATSVLTTVNRDATHHEWLPSVTGLAIAVLVGSLAGVLLRRSRAATQLTDAGVRVRGTASRWRSYPWDAVDGVYLRQGWTEDAVMKLRDGTGVTLRGLPLDTAEGLAERCADRALHHDEPPAPPGPVA